MKIALVQMSMGKEISENLDKSLKYCDMAENCDLVFFPEIQLTPFFPQYHNICVDHYCIDMDNDALVRLCQKAREHRYYLSPNVYLESEGARYDTSLWISPEGKIRDTAKMVHIAQNENFYEQDYYTPAEDGFKVFATPEFFFRIFFCRSNSDTKCLPSYPVHSFFRTAVQPVRDPGRRIKRYRTFPVPGCCYYYWNLLFSHCMDLYGFQTLSSVKYSVLCVPDFMGVNDNPYYNRIHCKKAR